MFKERKRTASVLIVAIGINDFQYWQKQPIFGRIK